MQEHFHIFVLNFSFFFLWGLFICVSSRKSMYLLNLTHKCHKLLITDCLIILVHVHFVVKFHSQKKHLTGTSHIKEP